MKVSFKRLAALCLGVALLAGAAGAAGVAQNQQQEPQANVAQEAFDPAGLLLESQAMAQVPQAALPSCVPSATPGLYAAQTQTAEGVTAETAQQPQPQAPAILEPVASGVLVKKDKKSVIDYSNTADGYVMVQFTAPTTKRLKAQVKGPTTTYTYNLTAGEWEVFPLSDGSGNYQVKVFENISGTKYAMVGSLSCAVSLKDEFAPFIRPNQYVDYAVAPNTIAKAQELTAGKTDNLQKVAAVYDYVIHNVSYDYNKAATVVSGYLPVLDSVLESKTGICFDYAALMTGMLRSQGVPCKLVVGYAGSAYHAWISVWSQDTGWIEGVVFFDGAAWQRMDPTYASTGGQTEWIMNFINNNANYTVKYLY